jgi:hypothetical protein
MKLSDFNDKHLGETIYIVGSAPSVNKISKEQLEFFKDKTVIGVNFVHSKFKDLSYIVTGHIDSLAYALEYTRQDIPIFCHKSPHTAYATEVWNNDRVVEVFDLNALPPLPRHADERSNIYGSISILLSATHLAYMMGAAKIVFIGFEERSQLHFYNVDRRLENEIISNIEKLLESRKYWNPTHYSPDWRGISNKINVHAALEVTLNKTVGVPHYQPQFNRSKQDLISTPFGTVEGQVQRTQYFAAYVQDLNRNGVQTLAIAEQGICLDANCDKISLEEII